MTIDTLPGFHIGIREHNDLLDAERTSDDDYIAQRTINALRSLAAAAHRAEPSITAVTLRADSGVYRFAAFTDATGAAVAIGDTLAREVERTIAVTMNAARGNRAVARYADSRPDSGTLAIAAQGPHLAPRRPVPTFPRNSADVSAMLRDPKGRINLAMLGRRH